jgi:hypothetical protein
VTQRPQPGVHPDADQISTFLEGAATEHERAEMLDHLAHCAACREMVFLARGAEAELRPAATPEGPPPTNWWRRWWMPFGLVGAAVAFSLALLIFLRQPATPVGNHEMATVHQPVNPVNTPQDGMKEKQTPQQPVRNDGPGGAQGQLGAPARKPSPAVGYGSGAGMGGQIAPPPPAFAMNNQAIEAARGNMARLSESVAKAAPATPVPAQNAPRALLNPAPPRPQAVQASQAPAGGPTATQAYSQSQGFVTGRNLGALQIMHGQGTGEGFGEVSGVVADVSGAAISRAAVSLRSASNGTVREVASGPDGRFRISDVPAGRYELRVYAPGFMVASEPLELKSRDVAMLDSVLQVGAASQTVTVEANIGQLQTSQAEVSVASVLQDQKLPGGGAAVARVVMGDRMLAVDSAGNLYLSRNEGKSWKKIKPQWPGKAAQLAVLPAHQAAASETITVKGKSAESQQVFELTTDTGAMWTSEDGKHWRPRAEGDR